MRRASISPGRSEPVTARALSLTGIRFEWKGAAPFRLELADFGMAPGERALLVGSSGSGKSTLLGLISGIIAPQQGQVAIGDTVISALSRRQRDRFRAEEIGVVFQQFNLLPYASPLDNILLPLRFAPKRRARSGAPRDAALRLTDAMGLDREIVSRGKAGELSVGQQQRVAVARALIGGPKLILADEPTSALDAAAQASFLDLLSEQVTNAGATLLLVSHDERLAPRFDRAIELTSIATVARSAAAA